MRVAVEVLIPKTGTKLTQALYKSTTGAKFFKLFDSSTITPLPSLTFRHFLRFALDCGYGAPNGMDKAQFLKISSSDQARLSDYLRARLVLLRHLLDDSVPGELRPHSITKFLESSDKSDASFLLGTIGCRYATEQWLTSKGTKIQRFWHFSLYSSPVATGSSFSFTSLKSGRKRRPDFLVQDENGSWYSVEAKGTFGPVNKGEILSGMLQASRLRSITFTSTMSGAQPTKKISDYACAGTHFDAKGRLSVTLVDPPNYASDEDGSEDGDNVQIISELADMLGFYNATRQFKNLGTFGQPRARQSVPDTKGISWSLLNVDGKFVKGSKTAVWIGIVEPVWRNATKLRNVLRVLEVVLPTFRNAYLRAQGANARSIREHLFAAINQIRSLKYDPYIWNNAHATMAKNITKSFFSESTPNTWEGIVQDLLTNNIFPQTEQTRNIEQFISHLNANVNAISNQHIMSNQLRRDSSAEEFQIEAVGHGLLIAAGNWKPEPLTLLNRRVKI